MSYSLIRNDQTRMVPGSTLEDIRSLLASCGLLKSHRIYDPKHRIVHLIPAYDFRSSSSHSSPSQIGVVAYQGVQWNHHLCLHDLHPSQLAPGCVIGTETASLPLHLSYFEVSCPRSAWALVMDSLYGFPSKELSFSGVTGTNGKTSTVWILHEMLKQLGVAHIVSGTFGCGGHLVDHPLKKQDLIFTGHTTPDPSVLFPLLHWAVTHQIKHVIMEISSHALVQKKIFGLHFDQVVLTSFSRDHLDFHSSMEEYFTAKWQLFEPPYSTGLTQRWLTTSVMESKYLSRHGVGSNPLQCLEQELSYTYDPPSTLRIQIPGSSERKVTVPYLGEFMQRNFLCALVIAQGIERGSPEELLVRLKVPSLGQVPGRMNMIHVHPPVILDYAHTPDALKRVLTFLAGCYPQEQIWCVVGCGGDRDQGKRAMMAQVATELSHRVILTSDNPRYEDPQKILSDMLVGVAPKYKNRAQLIEDREQAISHVLKQALYFEKRDRRDPVILIAGKGDERTQTIRGRDYPFYDGDVVEKFFNTTF